MIPQPTLRTSRLELRQFCPADEQRVALLANDEQLARNLRSFSYPYDVEDARNWISELSSEWDQGKSVVFGVCLRPADSGPAKLVGAIGIVLDRQSNRGELGYWVGRDYWGQGIATEACLSMLDFAFSQLGLNKVTAECLVRNPASARVLEKVQMRQEGYFENHFRKNETDEYCDVRVFGLLRTAWNART
ncbi:GNAT family N-acetyltransferase [Mariniblastus fucicola]|uniref:Ribosomal N-acetyltransferase YdaF n=1 Tax=Mariniblastus fucicola TaxID=980251 RepID=A0A5B9PHB1_9BACT|nr:GNAT family protein [Mariniblastus fucicola]QEG24645.1 Putative ribosomal N-acetyltransferase YdaF [Mariniblastus fucicola]